MLFEISVSYPRKHTPNTSKPVWTRYANLPPRTIQSTELIIKVVKKLHKVKESLKKFAHVNKKAFEQYSNFTKERDDLLKRRGELDNSAESIQELIETLDQRKDEAIERTFKQVSKYFEEVFEKLVPAGRGQLIMQTKADGFVVSFVPPRFLGNKLMR